MNRSTRRVMYLLALLAGSLPAHAQKVASSREVTLFVAPERVPCVGVAPMSCLQISTNASGPWQLHYDGIQGLDFQPGLFHEVRVRIEQLDYGAPVADAPSSRYVALEVVRRWPTHGAGGLDLLTAGSWTLRMREDLHAPQSFKPEAPVTLTVKSDGRISGSSGCNRYMGSARVDAEGQFLPGPLATTRMACAFEAMQTERDYLAQMATIVRYSVTPTELRLFGRDGLFALVFDRVKEP